MTDIASVSLALWCSDIEATAAFIAAITGASTLERHPGYARLNLGGTDLVLHSDEAFREHPWYGALQREGVTRGIGVEIRLAVPDVEAAHGRALAAGGATVVAPYDSGPGMECHVIGPDGYLFVLQAGIEQH